MPGYDMTGPAGYGPGSGRGMGPCGRGMAYGRGCRQGFARGNGRRNGYVWNCYPDAEPIGKEAQKQILEAELKRIEAEKAEIERRLNSIE